MEDPLPSFTKKGKDMFYENYQDRLNYFKLNSTQRRVERYRLIYKWKSLNWLAPSLGMTWNMNLNNRNGKICTCLELSPLHEPENQPTKSYENVPKGACY